MQNFITNLKASLKKSRAYFFEGLGWLAGTGGLFNENTLERIEEVLIGGDVGVECTERILKTLRERRIEIPDHTDGAMGIIRDEIIEILTVEGSDVKVGKTPTQESFHKPLVILLVGVNGTGKTTTAGKMAKKLHYEQKTVLLAACDTFRAAASEQLSIWARRTGSQFIHGEPGSDPASVAFDAVKKAEARDIDAVIIDTAGRLHTKYNLMAELQKIKRVLARLREDLPQEILLVLDATTGQNALSQARNFQEALGLTGVILAKLDGTARGGIVIAIAGELGLPVRMVGTGESAEDLQSFDPVEFAEALFTGD